MKEIKFKIDNKEIKQITGSIDTYTVTGMIEWIKESKNITIYLHTSGGDAQDAWLIYDLIKANKINLTVICGRVESAGLIILSAAKHKLAYSHSYFGFHLGYLTGTEKDKEKQHIPKLNYYNKLYQVLYPQIKIKKDMTYYTAKQMKKLGLIDTILK